jgi:hypothetical protein
MYTFNEISLLKAMFVIYMFRWSSLTHTGNVSRFLPLIQCCTLFGGVFAFVLVEDWIAYEWDLYLQGSSVKDSGVAGLVFAPIQSTIVAIVFLMYRRRLASREAMKHSPSQNLEST